MAHVKYVLMIVCIFSVGAKVVGHTYRHLNPPAVETSIQ
jgi:hypothetical protein